MLLFLPMFIWFFILGHCTSPLNNSSQVMEQHKVWAGANLVIAIMDFWASDKVKFCVDEICEAVALVMAPLCLEWWCSLLYVEGNKGIQCISKVTYNVGLGFRWIKKEYTVKNGLSFYGTSLRLRKASVTTAAQAWCVAKVL